MCASMESHVQRSWRNVSGAGVCGTCLAPGRTVRSVPAGRALLTLLLDIQLPEDCSLLICWQCEAAILNVQRFQKLLQNSQNILDKFWQVCHISSSEVAKPALLNTNRLSNSGIMLIETPGDITTIAPNDMKITILKPNINADNYAIPFSIEWSGESVAEKQESRLVHLNLEHAESDQSDDEALSSIRRKKIKVEQNFDSDTFWHSDEDLRKAKKLKSKKEKHKNRYPTRFKQVIVGEHEIHSDPTSEGEMDENTNPKRVRKSKKSREDVKPRGRQNDRFKKVTICEEAMLAAREQDRRVKWFVQGTFKCETCIIGYYNERHLAEHNRLKHNEKNPFACPICAVRLPDERQLAKHTTLHYRRIECRVCGEQQRSYRDMWRHHVSRHEPDKTFPCTHCSKVFQTRPSLVYHRRCDHRERAKCEHCGNTFRNQTTYKRHLLIHTGMPTYECKICNRSYRGKFGYLTHMKTHGPPPKDAYCVECDVQFKHGFQYRRHLKISPRHTDDSAALNRSEQFKKYPCSACEKKFVSPSVLKRHYDSVHLKLKRYNCDKCDKNYATPAALWTHRKMQHERVVPPRDKVCEVCGKGFRSNTTLVDHMRSHTGERPFSCDVCAATFRHNSGLYMHKRLIHKMGKKRAGVKDANPPSNLRTDLAFQCKLCPASFRHTSGLYMHNRLVHKNGMKKNERKAEEQDPSLYSGIELLM